MPETINTLSPGEQTRSGEKFSLNRGITHKQALQLIEFASSDTEVIGQTSDAKRFANKTSLERWLGKGGGRIIYTLADETENLCGIVWFGREQMPNHDFVRDFDYENYGITFAIRTYDRARGKHVSDKFLVGAIEDFTKRDFYKSTVNKGIWLETSDTNLPAKKLYEKTDWIRVSDPDSKDRILMIFKGENK